MWYKKFENENGFYQDENGTRYMVTECYRVIAPDGRRNAELGYTEFNNMDECLSTWGLSQVPETDLSKLSEITFTKLTKTTLTKLPEITLSKLLNKA